MRYHINRTLPLALAGYKAALMIGDILRVLRILRFQNQCRLFVRC